MKEEEKYLCPITREIMVEPVVDALGNTYDKAAIKEWLETNDTSPKTKMQLPQSPDGNLNKTLTPNTIIKTEITEYKKEKITKGLVILPKLLK